MEPDPNSPSPEAIFGNNIKFAKAVDSSTFGKLPDLKVSKNFNKKMIIFTFAKINNAFLNNLLAVNTFNNWMVGCRLLVSQQFTRGVIGPIGLETTDSELLDFLSSKYKDISKVQILKKGLQKLLSLTA